VSGTQGAWTNAIVQETHGGLTDDWNADLSDSDVRASTFGVDISAVASSFVTARIYYVAIRVQYTPPPATEFEYSGSVTITLVAEATTAHTQQSFAYEGDVPLALVVESATEYVNAGYVYSGNVTIQLIPAATASIEFAYTGNIPLTLGVESATEHVNQEFVYAGAIVLTLTPESAAAFGFAYAGSVAITLGVASDTEYTESVLQTTEWKGPGTAAQADRSGGAAWEDIENAIVDDSDFAKNVFVLGGTTDWLRLTNFGFDTDDIPVGSTITGIELKVNRNATGSGTRTDAIFLRDSSGQAGDSSGTQGDYSGGPEYEYHGGLTDDWNAVLSDSDIRASTFGIDLSAYEGGFYLALILYVQIRVQYSPPTTSIKTVFGVPIADIKTINGIPLANVKSFLGISNSA